MNWTLSVALLGEEEGEVQVAARPLTALTSEQTFGSGHLFVDQFDCGQPTSHQRCCPDTTVGDCG